MTYNVALLAGIDCLSREWEIHREDFFKYACSQTYDDRWQEEWFKNHMYNNYINVDTPITSRFFSLDDGNIILVIRYVKEVLMRGTSEREVYF